VQQEDLLEKKLDSIFNPVNPDEGFVKNLQKRLFQDPMISIEYPSFFPVVLFISFSFFLGILFIWIFNLIFHRFQKEKS